MKQGVIFTVTAGEYSDFGVSAVMYAERDFDLDATLDSWLAEHPEQRRQYNFALHKFLEHLESTGAVTSLAVPEIHMGSYSSAPTTPEKNANISDDVPRWVEACFDHEDCRAHPELGAACAMGPIGTGETR